jgi:hypothetical protein
MTLNEWAVLHRDEAIGELASAQEIKGLLALMQRELMDAGKSLSLDGRFSHAFWACLTIARIALRACGYRLRSAAHHYRAIESLEYTLSIDPHVVRNLQAFRAKRVHAEYEAADFITPLELEEVMQLAEELQRILLNWLRIEHRDLLA